MNGNGRDLASPARYPLPTGSHSFDHTSADLVNHKPLPEVGNPDGADRDKARRWAMARTRVDHISMVWQMEQEGSEKGICMERSHKYCTSSGRTGSFIVAIRTS